MAAIKVNFEIGHEASVRTKQTPEGFTHDWEVFVRGQEGADISHFVDKVVFILHDTFPKPRRVVKEPPFTIKESGYAGFIFPIEIYLKNKDEPKKIKFTYDLTLQQSGFLKDRYVFQSPNEEFRKKLLKGGGIQVSNNAFYTNPDQETRSRDSFTEEKQQQLVGKPKLSSENVKKHKTKEHKEEPPHRTSSFETLFGAPIQKPPKVSPDPKKIIEKSVPALKSDKKDKERSSSDKKSKHEQKEPKPDKIKAKEEKDKVKPEKVKNHSKDQDKNKEKANKRPIERLPSPEVTKKRCLSPNRRPVSPPLRSSSASSINKEDYKQTKHNSDAFEQRKQKLEEKPPEVKVEKDMKEKKKKEKKSHDKDKERKEKRDHKKESHKLKESPKEPLKEIVKEVPKAREVTKEKELTKESPPIKEKQKPEKAINKFSIENLRKTPPPENEDRSENHKIKEKSDPERKHKHKKKDKKRDESREKHKESNKEKKHKHDKIRDAPQEKSEINDRRPTPIPKERLMTESASPISIDTASQCSSKSGLVKASHVGAEDISNSDSESSMIAEEDVKVKVENPSPEPVKREPSPEPEPEIDPELEVEPEIEPEPEPVVEPPPQKEKSKKHKDKSSKREEKRRKRKAAEEEDVENRKSAKIAEGGPSNNENDRGETSGSVSAETKVQDNGVSSSLGEDAEPGDLSPDYMVQLRGLQQRIMMIKNNEDLERVVNLIAETGRYEVTTQTFDFDLCLLDRSTVQQLIQLVGC